MQIDTIPYVHGKNISSTIESSEKTYDVLFQWFSDNHMKANENKFHVLLLTDENVLVNIGKYKIAVPKNCYESNLIPN